jgi:P4 family phage/plasmid primase-like protien
MPDTYRPAQFFNPDYGLMAHRAAEAVLKHQPLRIGADRAFWAYGQGLWAPADNDVSKTIVRLLHDRYRPHHETAVLRVLRALVPELPENPVERKINMSNGMLHWDHPTGPELLSHHDLYMSRVQLPVRWKDSAECPEFDAFVDACVAPDDRQRLWEIIGYLMMWGNPLQRMFLLTGAGGNGKGVLLAVITALLGERNCAAVPLHQFIEDRFAPADLYGMLANICGDIDAEYIERTGRIKELAGEDSIRAEHKGQRAFRFQFQGKSIFSANGIPSSSDASVGWTRRWEVVEFPNAPRVADRGLKARLCRPESLEGIARKAVLALRDLMARGEFQHGAAAIRVHEDFAQKSNKVLLWLDESAVRVPGTHYDRRELLKLFRHWDAFENPAARQMGSQTFYDRMRAIPWVRELTVKGVRGFGGFRFRSEIAYGAVVGDPEPADETAPDPKGAIPGQDELPL